MNIELETKLDLLHAQLSAITGSRGVEVLEEMGAAAANSFLGGCLNLSRECLEMVAPSSTERL
ncbi:MAG: hypothetical protein HZY77_16300 [Thiobacillus sp.]|uniref:hypothetical protein n=1 Tax=Thiobacillus sp. TaxID=924 RepID=UPI00168C52DB|nr:hypothetical protein [Thiobacillus sp.]QLQ04096.1 MAG: hypothetical protein HZY77_16300 [Thiobacillus sp.]